MYSGDMAIGTWLTVFSQSSNQIVNDLESAYNLYKKWYNFSYGQTNAQLATLLNTDVNHIQDIQNAAGAFFDMYNALNNVAITQEDRLSLFLKMT